MTGSASFSLRPNHPVARQLDDLVAEFHLTRVGPPTPASVTGVSLDSSTVVPGDLYVGLSGARDHGANYATQAAAAGAVAVLTDVAGQERACAAQLPVIIADDPRSLLGAVAAWVYRTAGDSPRLLGVTGTNGKTTVVYFLYALIRQLGDRAGLTSTAERRIGEQALVSSLTTPEAPELHALLARMREERVAVAAIEVSAQALSRHRVDGVHFDVVGFTNLSHDHLDDYATMDDYFDAKRELFVADRAARAVVTVGSPWGDRLAATCPIPVTTLTTSPEIPAQWCVQVTSESLDGTAFTLRAEDGRKLTTWIPLIGAHNAANAALAIVMLVELGYSFASLQQAVETPDGIPAYVPGRTEVVSGPRGPRVLIDYGHTPDAFRATLSSLRAVTSGRIIMLFGADGNRDTTKRSEMGAIAARGADVVIVTDFHPRWEDPAEIRRALMSGALLAVPDGDIREIPDPHEALRAALDLAQSGDVVLYAGPGHEDYREVAGMHLPYSAREDARSTLREAGWL